MNEDRLEGLDRLMLVAVRYGLFVVFLLPFFVFRSYLYPWVSGKIWGIEILVAVLFPMYVFLAFRRKEYRPTRNVFMYAVLAFFAVATLSMLFGDNIDRSLWSKPDRQTGMYFQYHLLAFFIMAGAVWRGHARKVIIASVGTSIILALHGFGQAYLSEAGERGSATLGNPSYLGQYLSANVMLAAWLLWHDRHKAIRWLWGISAFLIALGIMASKSRGALIAIFISALFAGIVLAWKGKGKGRKWGRIALLAIVLSGVGFYALDSTKGGRTWLYEQRLSRQYLKESTGSRVLLLENARKGFTQRPVLGWGPENFESAYYLNYVPETYRYSQYETRQDRPHNIVLDLLVNLGFVGFAAYAVVYLSGWRRLVGKDLEEHGQRLFLMLSTVALLSATLFIFDTPASYLLQYVLLALIMATTTKEPEHDDDDGLVRWAGIAALATGIVSIWSVFWVIGPTIDASKIGARLILSTQHGVYDGEAFDEEVVKLIESRSPLAERNLRAVAANLSRSPGEYLSGEFLPVMRRLADYHIERVPQNANDYVHALVTTVSIMSIAPEDRTEMQEEALAAAIEQMKALSPNRQEVYWMEADYLKEKGDKEGELSLYRKAIELDPETDEAHSRYAAALVVDGRIEEAFAHLDENRKLLQLDRPGSHKNLQHLSRSMAILYDRQEFDLLEQAYVSAEAHDLMSPQWVLAGIVGAAAEGDLEKARARADLGIETYPDEAQNFRNVISIAEQGGIGPKPDTP